MSKKEEIKSDLNRELIKILLQEHKSRRDSIYAIVEELKSKMYSNEDEIEASISIEHFNDIMASSIKNDSNIVKLIELLLKYDYEGSTEDLKEIRKYQTSLSENKLDINFDE